MLETPEGFINKILKNKSELIALDVSNVEFDLFEVTQLADSLEENSYLQSLKVSGLDCDGLEILCGALIKRHDSFPELVFDLDLSSNPCDLEMLNALFDCAFQRGINLSSLLYADLKNFLSYTCEHFTGAEFEKLIQLLDLKKVKKQILELENGVCLFSDVAENAKPSFIIKLIELLSLKKEDIPEVFIPLFKRAFNEFSELELEDFIKQDQVGFNQIALGINDLPQLFSIIAEKSNSLFLIKIFELLSLSPENTKSEHHRDIIYLLIKKMGEEFSGEYTNDFLNLFQLMTKKGNISLIFKTCEFVGYKTIDAEPSFFTRLFIMALEEFSDNDLEKLIDFDPEGFKRIAIQINDLSLILKRRTPKIIQWLGLNLSDSNAFLNNPENSNFLQLNINDYFFRACGFDISVDAIEFLIGLGAKVDYIQSSNDWCSSSLNRAASVGNCSIINYLIDHGVNPEQNFNKGSEGGYTTLLVAAIKGQTEAVKTLIAHGVNLNACTTQNRNALVLAVTGGHKETAQVLIESKIQIDEEVLWSAGVYWAATHYRIDFLEFLNKRINQNCHFDRKEIVNKILCDLLRTNPDVELGSAIIFLVDECGADINLRDSQGLSPLLIIGRIYNPLNMLLLSYNNGSLSLTEKNAVYSANNLHRYNNDEMTPLRWAIVAESSTRVEKILQQDPNLLCNRDSQGRSHFHWAVLNFRNFHPEYFRLLKLLYKEGSLDERDVNGDNAYIAAIKNTGSSALMLLRFIFKQCNPATKQRLDLQGNTDLVIACELGNRDIVELILKNGSDYTLKSSKGLTALEITRQAGNQDIVELIEAHIAQCNDLPSPSVPINQDPLKSNYIQLIKKILDFNSELNTTELPNTVHKMKSNEENKPIGRDLKPFEFFKAVPSKPQIKSEINQGYQYEDNDITAIFFARLMQLKQENPNNNFPNIQILAAVDNITPNQLVQRLRADIENCNGVHRCILIPCNLGNYHWVGIGLEINAQGKIIREAYIDSLKGVAAISQAYLAQMQVVYPDQNLSACTLLKQDDGTSCGAYTIENLLIFAQQLQGDDRSTLDIRRQHLQCLQQHNPYFYEEFNPRQKNNLPVVANLSQQMQYQKNLEAVRFSSREHEQILNASKCVYALTDIQKQNLLWDALLQDHADNVKSHLNIIREAFRQLLKEIDPVDNNTVINLVRIFFGIEWSHTQDASEILNADFRINHEALKAIGHHRNISSEISENFLKEIEKQIQDDEGIAKKLQEQFNEELSKSKNYIETKSGNLNFSK